METYSDVTSTINVIISSITLIYSVYKGLKYGGIISRKKGDKTSSFQRCIKCVDYVAESVIKDNSPLSVSPTVVKAEGIELPILGVAKSINNVIEDIVIPHTSPHINVAKSDKSHTTLNEIGDFVTPKTTSLSKSSSTGSIVSVSSSTTFISSPSLSDYDDTRVTETSSSHNQIPSSQRQTLPPIKLELAKNYGNTLKLEHINTDRL